jgi:hypothetical protein
MKTIPLILFVIVVLFATCKKKNEFKNLDCSTIDSKYSTSIKNIMSANCTTSGCHDGNSYGAVDLRTYNNIKPYIDNGKFNQEVIVDKTMPKGKTLSQGDRDKIKCWLDSGAPNN